MAFRSEGTDPLADLDHPDISKSHQRGNVELLRESLLASETLLVVAEANRRRFSMGLIALTTQRFVYVQTRIVRKPIVRSLAIGAIEGARIELAPLYGRLILQVSGRDDLRFDLVRPKERVYPFLWQVQKLSGSGSSVE